MHKLWGKKNRFPIILKKALIAYVFLNCFAMAIAESPGLAQAKQAYAEERIPIKAKVNGKPIWLFFDTGAEYSVLFTQAANRIGLKFERPPAHITPEPGKVLAGISEECQITILNRTFNEKFRILDIPRHLTTFDGVLSWNSIKRNIIELRCDERSLRTLKSLPKYVHDWTEYSILPKSKLLAIEIESAENHKGVVYIDTGYSGGVELNPKRWRECVKGAPSQGLTLEAVYTPADGLIVHKVAWARRLKLGSISISEVPVRTCLSRWPHKPHYEASLGLFALTRLNIIIDGRRFHNKIYVQPNRKPHSKYQYNRMGAVFVPQDMESSELIAHVIDGSPAHNAGVRNGDELLKIGDLDATKWKTDPRVLPLWRFWNRPAGTQIELTLTRQGKPFKVVVTLRDIFSREGKDNK